MRALNLMVAAICIVVTSCTLDKTDYEAEIDTVVPEYYEFKEAASFAIENYTVSIQALNGTFYKGYNEIRVFITDTETNEKLNAAEVTFLPILNTVQGYGSCPHEYNLVFDAEHQYYKGYSVFTDISSLTESWNLYVSFTNEGKVFNVNGGISVAEQQNKNLNMTAFTGNDGEHYYIALIAPQKPGVAENNLVAGIYKYNTPQTPAGDFPDPGQFSYSKVNGYTLEIDPRMPEPSMGNHSSPNNQDLTQGEDGLYYGVVNYTMTGNWTLNFIMRNQNGLILKGTEVPTDFTPGVEGAKSELYIDILF